jgi:lipopolysaccharide biosynthesis glycosyltransferase
MYAIGLCVDRRYLLPSLATLTSVADALPAAERREVAVRVLTTDLVSLEAKTLAALARHCGFRSFDIRRQAALASSVMTDSRYISVTTYLRFAFTPEFVDRPYLVYLDADVLVRGDIGAPLHQLPPERIGAVRDEFNPAVGECPALPGLAERWPHLVGQPYFNAGMLWIPTGMLMSLRSGVEEALRRGRRYIKHNDQCALNLWLLASGAVHPVEPAFNRFEVGRFLERGDWVRRVLRRSPTGGDAKAVHFVGEHKPWLASCPGTEEVRGYRSHLRWTLRQAALSGGERILAGAR